MPYATKEALYRFQKKYRIEIRKKILDFLSTKACIDCGETDPVVLDFDHVNPRKKFKSVSKMLSGHYSWNSVLEEIEKCQVRCANCHRRRTYVQFGFFGKTPL